MVDPFPKGMFTFVGCLGGAIFGGAIGGFPGALVGAILGLLLGNAGEPLSEEDWL